MENHSNYTIRSSKKSKTRETMNNKAIDLESKANINIDRGNVFQQENDITSSISSGNRNPTRSSRLTGPKIHINQADEDSEKAFCGWYSVLNALQQDIISKKELDKIGKQLLRKKKEIDWTNPNGEYHIQVLKEALNQKGFELFKIHVNNKEIGQSGCQKLICDNKEQRMIFIIGCRKKRKQKRKKNINHKSQYHCLAAEQNFIHDPDKHRNEGIIERTCENLEQYLKTNFGDEQVNILTMYIIEPI